MTAVLTELAAAPVRWTTRCWSSARRWRAAVLIVTSDRGMCGGYNSNALRSARELIALLEEEGKQPVWCSSLDRRASVLHLPMASRSLRRGVVLAEADLRRRRSGCGSARRPVHGGIGESIELPDGGAASPASIGSASVHAFVTMLTQTPRSGGRSAGGSSRPTIPIRRHLIATGLGEPGAEACSIRCCRSMWHAYPRRTGCRHRSRPPGVRR